MAPYKLLAVFLLLGIAGSQDTKAPNKAPDLASLSDAVLNASTITFERQRCFGDCPDYTLTFHGDGRVEYLGRNHVKVKETKEGHIEPATIEELIKEFAKADFFSIADQYGEGNHCACKRQCTDMPTVITGLTVSGATHRVTHYYGCGCAPQALFELESAIDKAAHSEQWTGDVSKAGPHGTTCFGG